jgi:3'(2'), 5'-bisphosphate nucleotidase
MGDQKTPQTKNANAGKGGSFAESLDEIVPALIAAASAGGRALLAAPFDRATVKPDGSPVTPADIASDAAIQGVLRACCPDIRCISEENLGSFSNEDSQKPFFLIDPLDGTKEYINGKPDFAVCIGYIVNQRPVAGIILAPILRKAWLAAETATMFELDANLDRRPKTERRLSLLETKTAVGDLKHLRIISSRSHADPKTLALIARNAGASHQTLGSAVKFTALAEGEADLYPRGTGSMEWDTAAGEALILAAGGAMLTANGKPLLYGRWQKGFLNDPFIAASNRRLVLDSLAQWDAC